MPCRLPSKIASFADVHQALLAEQDKLRKLTSRSPEGEMQRLAEGACAALSEATAHLSMISIGAAHGNNSSARQALVINSTNHLKRVIRYVPDDVFLPNLAKEDCSLSTRLMAIHILRNIVLSDEPSIEKRAEAHGINRTTLFNHLERLERGRLIVWHRDRRGEGKLSISSEAQALIEASMPRNPFK